MLAIQFLRSVRLKHLLNLISSLSQQPNNQLKLRIFKVFY